MRIFERLRRRGRSERAIERKLFEVIVADLMQKVEDGTSILVFPESKPAYCPTDEKARRS
jgi:hypothetical protein